MNGFLTDAGSLIVQVVFELYVFAVLLRFLFQLVRADFYNPISQFLVTITNPLLRPLRRIIPGVFGIDVASVVLLVALKYAELFLIQLILNRPAAPIVLVLATLVDLIGMTINVFFFAVIIRALLSWFSPYGIRHTPAGSLLVSLTEPLLRPARRLIPPVGGLDLSPLVVLVLLQIAQLALNHFLRGF